MSAKQKQLMLVAVAALGIIVVVGVLAFTLSQNRSSAAESTLRQTNATKTSANPSGKTTGIEAYAADMERYKDMSVETFNQLPRGERLAYSQYLIDSSRGDYEVLYGKKSANHDHMINPAPVSIDYTGQEIWDYSIYTSQVAWLQYLSKDEDKRPAAEQAKALSYDLSDGEKVLSSSFYNVSDPGKFSKTYLKLKAKLETLTSPNAIVDKVNTTSSSALLTGKNADNEAVKYKVINYVEDVSNNTVYSRFVYVGFTSYDGTKKSVWLLDDQAYSVEELSSLGSVR